MSRRRRAGTFDTLSLTDSSAKTLADARHVIGNLVHLNVRCIVNLARIRDYRTALIAARKSFSKSPATAGSLAAASTAFWADGLG